MIMPIKNLLRFSLSFILLIGIFFSAVGTASAQDFIPGDIVTFNQLLVTDISLKGPLESDSLRFILPAKWELTSGAELHLNMHVYAGEAINASTESVRPVAGFLTVRINNTWIETITLDHTGDYSIVIPIPSDTWLTTPRNARQTIRLSLESAQSCDMIMAAFSRGIFTGLNTIIHSTSFLVLPHTETADLPLDFKLFPYPLYQQTFIPDQALLIIPQHPTESELRAAVTASSALGSLTQKKLSTTFVTADQVDPAALNESNVIFVGKPDSAPVTLEALWPIEPKDGRFTDPQITEDDGVLQLAVSPRNPAKAWLMVSGNSDAGVLKAAQSLGSALHPGSRSDLAIVTAISPQSIPVGWSDVTFGNLGYDDQSFIGYNDFSFDYWFDVPLDYKVSDGAYLDLLYSNSALLNFEEVSLTVKLNNQFLGGLRFNERTTSATQYRFSLPSGAFKSGSNQLTLNISLKGATPCVRNDDVWAAISSLSLLHMPIEPEAPTAQTSFQFVSYPKRVFPFFGNTTFIVAKDDPDSWISAARVAFNMGGTRRGPIINPNLVTPDNLTQEIRNNNDLLLVGKASTLPVLQELAPRLPAPFAPDSDLVTERDAQVSFRVAENNPIGYLQILASPWNPKRAILLIAGNSADGLASAVTALTDTDRLIYPDLQGNYALISGLQLVSRQVVIKEPETVLVAATPVATQASGQAPQTDLFNLDLLTLGIILMIVVIALSVIFWLVNRKPREQQPPQP